MQVLMRGCILSRNQQRDHRITLYGGATQYLVLKRNTPTHYSHKGRYSLANQFPPMRSKQANGSKPLTGLISDHRQCSSYLPPVGSNLISARGLSSARPAPIANQCPDKSFEWILQLVGHRLSVDFKASPSSASFQPPGVSQPSMACTPSFESLASKELLPISLPFLSTQTPRAAS